MDATIDDLALALQLADAADAIAMDWGYEADHPFEVCDAVPEQHLIGRWQWFCSQVRQGRKRAEVLWPLITDPPQ